VRDHVPPLAADAYRYHHPIEVRFVDTDAFGHVNNAVYLTYFEAARAGYYAALTGRPFSVEADPERPIFVVARAVIDFRSPALFGEPLAVACRVEWVGRSSFGLSYRIDAAGSTVGIPRVVASGETVQVMVDATTGRATRMTPEFRAQLERFEGRDLPDRPRA
jgi:acyl-CoA thioester hydrolase